jgi:3D (Asp-Asp-Asp) domain-containing protein
MNTKYTKPEMIILIIIILSLCLGLHMVDWHTHTDGTDTDEPYTEVTGNGLPSFIEVEMNVSGFCKGACCCENFADGITASGSTATGLLIAAPKTYTFGTRMDVPGYGTALVEDRGGAIKGDKLDLLFPSHQAALNWGRKTLTVKVYE